MFSDVLDYFRQIAGIPRGSGNEKAVSDYLVTFAKAHGLRYIQDEALNVIIFKEASEGFEDAEPVILQGHMDMVCEKEPGSQKDMARDGIDLVFTDGSGKVIETDRNGVRPADAVEKCDGAIEKALSKDSCFLSAEGTTLGGDDGIAVAMALGLLSDETLKSPAIEFVCTVGEEVGMIGASRIDLSMLKGRRLLNLDSENEGEFMAGCAGGGTVKIVMPVDRTYPDSEPDDLTALHITLSGLSGGHSGQYAASGRANAAFELCGVLKKVISEASFRILYLSGGGKDNAIPRTAEAHIVFHGENGPAIKKALDAEAVRLKEKFKETDPELSLDYSDEGYEIHLDAKVGGNLLTAVLITDEDHKEEEAVLTPLMPDSTRDILNLVMALPNGLISMCDDRDGMLSGLPETSLNLGIMNLERDSFSVSYCVRSNVGSKYTNLTKRMKEIAKSTGASYKASGEYPAWDYVPESPFRDELIALYEDMYGKKPSVNVIHAGVECGLLISRIEGCEAVSIGPDMKDIHTYQETLDLASSKRVYEFVRAFLQKK